MGKAVSEKLEKTGKKPSLQELQTRIISDWTDYNGHLNVTWITYLFDLATDNLLDWLSLGEAYVRAENRSTFALAAHVRYLGEAHEGQLVTLRSRLVGADAKRIHYVHVLSRAPDDSPVATLEQLSIHVDLETRRSAAWSEPQAEMLVAASVGAGDVPLCGAIHLKEVLR